MTWPGRAPAVAFGLAAAALPSWLATQPAPTPEGKAHPRLVSMAATRCELCHQQLLQGKATVHPPAAEGCATCHQAFIGASGTRMGLVKSEPALCLECHDGLQEAARLALPAPHAPVAQSCVACHDPHAASVRRLLVKPGAELCFSCHERPGLRRSHGREVDARQDCLGCHLPHGSTLAHMLAGSRPPASLAGPAATPAPVGREAAPAKASAPAGERAEPEAPFPSTSPAAKPVTGSVPRLAPWSLPAPGAGAAPSDAAEAQALLREGQLPEAARVFAARLKAVSGAYTVQIFVACQSDTVLKAVANVQAEDFYILAVRYRGQDCYRLGWGVYKSQALAKAALAGVPRYFSQDGARPSVVAVSEILR